MFPNLPGLLITKPGIWLRLSQHQTGVDTRFWQNWKISSQWATYELWDLRPAPQPLCVSVSLLIKRCYSFYLKGCSCPPHS